MDYNPEELIGLVRRGSELEDLRNRGVLYEPPKNRALGMVFERASTRIRLSFETGIIRLGGQAIFLSPRDTQLGRGESTGGSAQVISRMLNGVMIHTFAHATLMGLVIHLKAPVINGLSDDLRPCQLLVDTQTFHEHHGSIQGKIAAWIGDGNNVCSSYIEATLKFDFQLRVTYPEGYEPKAELATLVGNRLYAVHDPREVVTGAHLVNTNMRTSMDQEDEVAAHIAPFRPYQVNATLLDGTADGVLFTHCLPTHRGKRISEELLDDPRSVAWDQAESRLHMQKALLKLLIEHAYYT